jgi:hypothetical protein
MKLKKLVLLSSLLIGLSPQIQAQMKGTAHDFTGYRRSAYNPSGEVCIVCHAPHNTSTTSTPLWNHTTTAQTFTAYGANGSGFNIHFTPGQPDGSSKMCLSCHDGITAANSYGVNGGSPALQDSITLATGGATAPRTSLISRSNLTTDLTNDHPISFVYTEALASNPKLRDTAFVTALGHSIGKDMLDKNGKIQCASCHDPHGNDQGWNSTYLKFSNANSAMCLTCHIK